jgi:hypothetical protein
MAEAKIQSCQKDDTLQWIDTGAEGPLPGDVKAELTDALKAGAYLSTVTLWLIWRFAFPPETQLHVAMVPPESSGNTSDKDAPENATETDRTGTVLVADLDRGRLCKKTVVWSAWSTEPETIAATSNPKHRQNNNHYVVFASFNDPNSVVAKPNHYSTLSRIVLSQKLKGRDGSNPVFATHFKSLLNAQPRRQTPDDKDGTPEASAEDLAPHASDAMSEVQKDTACAQHGATADSSDAPSADGDELYADCIEGVTKAITDEWGSRASAQTPEGQITGANDEKRGGFLYIKETLATQRMLKATGQNLTGVARLRHSFRELNSDATLYMTWETAAAMLYVNECIADRARGRDSKWKTGKSEPAAAA